jgi:hypothetical protein
MMSRELRIAGGTNNRMLKRNTSFANFLRTIMKVFYWSLSKIVNLPARKDLNFNGWQKLKVASVLVSLVPLRTFELVRLKLGGEERR